MELYIGKDVKIVHITILNDTKGINPYNILCSTCINMKYKKRKKLDDKNVLWNSAHIMQLTQLIIKVITPQWSEPKQKAQNS